VTNQNKLKQIFKQFLEDDKAVDGLKNDASLLDLNIDSITAKKIVVAIEDEFEIIFDNDKINPSDFESLDSLTNYIILLQNIIMEK